MVAKIIALLVFSLPCVAQDFEPDRRPEEALYASLDFVAGAPLNRGYLQTTPTVVGTSANLLVSSPFVSLLGGVGYRWNYSSAHYSRPFTAMVWARRTGQVYGHVLCGTAGALDGNGYTLGGWSLGAWPNYYPGLWAEVNTASAVANPAAPGSDYWGEWIHLAVATDASTSRFFINGVLASSASTTAGNIGRTGYTNLPMGVGAGFNSGGALVLSAFSDLADFRYFESRALSASEVYGIFVSTKERFRP